MGALRFLLALSVVFSHTIKESSWSGFGSATSVEIFFLVSGFAMDLNYRRNYTSPRKFYLARALRVYPIYFLVLCTLLPLSKLLVVSWDTSEASKDNHNLLIEALSWISNLTFIGSDWLMFLGIDSNGGISFSTFSNSSQPLIDLLWISVIWSLGIEVTYYLLVPVFARMNTRKLLMLTCVLLLIRVGFYTVGYNFDPWTYRFFPFEIPIFLIGVLAARASEKYDLKTKPSAILLWGILLSNYLVVGHIEFYVNPPRFLVLGYVLFISLLVLLFLEDGRVSKILGDYSYPLYLAHLPIFTMVATSKFIDLPNSDAIESFIVVVLSLVFSWIALWLTKPISRYRGRFRNEGNSSANSANHV